jgi:hypothetical protein
MKLLISALVFALFVPGVLVRLPPGGSQNTVLVVHAILFALLHAVVLRFVSGAVRSL